jgi:hypothetical protein
VKITLTADEARRLILERLISIGLIPTGGYSVSFVSNADVGTHTVIVEPMPETTEEKSVDQGGSDE